MLEMGVMPDVAAATSATMMYALMLPPDCACMLLGVRHPVNHPCCKVQGQDVGDCARWWRFVT